LEKYHEILGKVTAAGAHDDFTAATLTEANAAILFANIHGAG